MAIQSFSDKVTQHFYESGKAGKAGWSKVAPVAARKLDLLNAAEKLSDLKAPPGNNLEALIDDLEGFHSIRVNLQWRVVFRWTEAGPAEVRICDYH